MRKTSKDFYFSVLKKCIPELQGDEDVMFVRENPFRLHGRDFTLQKHVTEIDQKDGTLFCSFTGGILETETRKIVVLLKEGGDFGSPFFLKITALYEYNGDIE